MLDRGQVISPASVYMEDFNPDMASLTPPNWLLWFHRVEMLAKLGIADDVPAVRQQIDYLVSYLDENGGFFVKPLSHYYFMKWSQYTGLALEKSWRIKDARRNDLTFRSLLIHKLAGRGM